jgi:hypothetical protein
LGARRANDSSNVERAPTAAGAAEAVTDRGFSLPLGVRNPL